jgi:hypothetical protein
MHRTRKLTYFLIAKTFLETSLTLALVAYFNYADFLPGFRGWLDVANEREIAGWVMNRNVPSESVEVQLYINDRFVASQMAGLARPDVGQAERIRGERYGFRFETPRLDPGEYEARVYAVHESRGGARRTLQLIGTPLRLTVNSQGAQPIEVENR